MVIKTPLVATFVFICLLATPAVAHAYVGPGAGIGLIGAALGLVLGVFTAIGVVVTWPLRNLRKRANGRRVNDAAEAGASAAKALSD